MHSTILVDFVGQEKRELVCWWIILDLTEGEGVTSDWLTYSATYLNVFKYAIYLFYLYIYQYKKDIYMNAIPHLPEKK